MTFFKARGGGASRFSAGFVRGSQKSHVEVQPKVNGFQGSLLPLGLHDLAQARASLWPLPRPCSAASHPSFMGTPEGRCLLTCVQRQTRSRRLGSHADRSLWDPESAPACGSVLPFGRVSESGKHCESRSPVARLTRHSRRACSPRTFCLQLTSSSQPRASVVSRAPTGESSTKTGVPEAESCEHPDGCVAGDRQLPRGQILEASSCTSLPATISSSASAHSQVFSQLPCGRGSSVISPCYAVRGGLEEVPGYLLPFLPWGSFLRLARRSVTATSTPPSRRSAAGKQTPPDVAASLLPLVAVPVRLCCRDLLHSTPVSEHLCLVRVAGAAHR